MSFWRSFGVITVCAIGTALPCAQVFAADENASSTSLVASSTEIAIPTPPSPRQFLRMDSGQFFDPASGLSANSEEELRRLLTGESSEPSISTTTPPIVPEPSQISIQEPPASVVPPILLALERARQALAQQIVDDQAAHPATTVNSLEVWINVTLAVWNKQTDALTYVDLQKKDAQIRNVKGTTESVKLLRANGVNSAFSVGESEDNIVLAIKYPIFKPVSGKKNTYTLDNVVYTPYSQRLHVPEMVTEGRTYLDQVVDGVYAKLRAEGLHSRMFPDQLVVDVVDPGVVKSIAAIEHLDQSGLTKDAEQALESFLVILAGNRQDSYAYSRSSAGALGLVQFIPSTYNRLAAQSALGLDTNFERGMSKPENAIRAQVLYLDILMDEFPSSFRDRLAANPSRAQEYVVAAYNGGSSRVRKAMDSWDGMFDGTEAKALSKLQTKYNGMKEEIESLRQKTLRQKEKKLRAKLQAQLDAKRVEAKRLAAQISADESSLLRKETISYILKYRALQEEALFPAKTTTVVTTTPTGTVSQN